MQSRCPRQHSLGPSCAPGETGVAARCNRRGAGSLRNDYLTCRRRLPPPPLKLPPRKLPLAPPASARSPLARCSAPHSLPPLLLALPPAVVLLQSLAMVPRQAEVGGVAIHAPLPQEYKRILTPEVRLPVSRHGGQPWRGGLAGTVHQKQDWYRTRPLPPVTPSTCGSLNAATICST